MALHRNFTFHPAINHNGFTREFGDGVDKFANINILHIQFKALGQGRARDS